MADTDVIGILSLVLAAAGAAYLVWTRVLRASPRDAEVQPGAGDPAAGAGDGRPVASSPRSGAPQAAGPGEERAVEAPAPGLRREDALPSKPRAREEVRATLQSARPPPPASASPPSESASPPSEFASPPSESASASSEFASASVSSSVAGAAKEAASVSPLSSAVASAAGSAATSSKRLARAEVSPAFSRSASALGASKGTPGAGTPRPGRAETPSVARSPAAPAVGAAPVSRDAKPVTPARASDAVAGGARVEPSASVRAAPAVKPARAPNPSAAPPIVETSVLDEGADAEPEGEASPALAVHALGRTDPGKRRKDNEDSLLVLEAANVFAVADGMGEQGGQTASRLAVATIAEAFEHACFDAAPHAGVPRAASELARAIQMANAAIRQEAKAKPELEGMGSTLSAARLTAGARRLYIGHVGDSRCYRLRDGVMKQLTTDYAVSDHGVAGPDGARPSRVLGAGPAVSVDVILAEPRAGDVYLLCTRGLTKMIPDGTIATQLLHEEDPKAALERLVFFANAHGGKENITAILLRVVAAPR